MLVEMEGVVMVIAPGFNGSLDAWIRKIVQPGMENLRANSAQPAAEAKKADGAS